MKKDLENAMVSIRGGGVGILPTDTIYGIVGSALDSEAVRRIYRLRRRNMKKPMIILIGSIKNLLTFGVRLTPRIKKTLNQIWPGKVSVVLPIDRRGDFLKRFHYLHRGTGTLAFRLPKSKTLRGLLEKTGPLVAPSANFEGEPAAKTIRDAKKYFRKNVDFYSDRGRLDGRPSTIISLVNENVVIVRQGSVSLRDIIV